MLELSVTLIETMECDCELNYTCVLCLQMRSMQMVGNIHKINFLLRIQIQPKVCY